MRLAVPSLPQRVEANAESAAEEPYDADGYPTSEEFLAEDVSGAVHGHWPELEAISLCSHTCCRVTMRRGKVIQGLMSIAPLCRS